MSYEIKVNGEIMPIELLDKTGNKIKVAIDDRKYELDLVEVEKGIYSILLDGVSFNVELTPLEPRVYTIDTLYDHFDVEVIDPETRYINNRKSGHEEDLNFISTPMPGKIVKILVKEGDTVLAGETCVIVSAMKMESEYKVVSDKKVKRVLVKEGDNIEGNQPLILLDNLPQD